MSQVVEHRDGADQGPLTFHMHWLLLCRLFGLAAHEQEHGIICNLQFLESEASDSCFTARGGGADDITYQMIPQDAQLHFVAADISMSHCARTLRFESLL